MGKATPFEGEFDYWGNPTCGQSFMAGTICSRPLRHIGSCAAECQNCGGDWMIGTCSCPPHCNECDRELLLEVEVDEGYCGYCLADPEVAEHLDQCEVRPVTPEELAEVYKSFGVPPPM